MAYNLFKFNAPDGGWPELKRTGPDNEPRECNFKPIQCTVDGPCSKCEHAPEELRNLKHDKR